MEESNGSARAVLESARLSGGVGAFEAAGRELLSHFALLVGRREAEYRFCELEFYFYSEIHPDPFTHCHPLQLQSGTWYFHRAGDKETSGYRGGSFKGLDLCIGGDKCFGGVLIRAIQTPLERINGPSLVVDKILADCGEASVKDLVDRLPSLSCEDETSCLRVVRMKETSNLTVTCTARVGLSLRKFSDSSSRPLDFIARRYRFLTEVAKSKHKHLVAVELKKDGLSVEQISNRIGTSRRSVSRWLAQFDRGKSRSGVPNYVESFLNQNMDVAMVCELLGALS